MERLRALAERIRQIAMEPFLGIACSLSGKRWRQRGGDDRKGLALAQRLALPEVVGRIIAARDVEPDDVPRYLAPTLRDFLPDPSRLRDMDAAVALLIEALERGRKIAVFGDYDVDGATSAALLQRYFAALGVAIRVHIPDRQRDGYGPNIPALRQLRDEGVELVVTVDCGTTAYQPLEAAQAIGLDVIVIDHHAAEPKLPPAAAIVNPNRLDDDSGAGTLAAVGVTFLLAVALNRELKARRWFGAGPAPDLLQHLDLVALGTVCDVVPLTGLNRALVAQGLKVAAGRGKAGLAALADGAAIAERIDAYHLGYVLGPRINAGGRVGRSDLGCRLLATDDPAEARALAAELEQLNADRRGIEAGVLEAAIRQTDGQAAAPLVIASGAGWHPGVIGIVAGRLKERYNRPACVIAWDEDGGSVSRSGIGRGSGRSVPGVDLGAAIIAARQAGYLAAGGGHRMAAGFSLEASALPGFAQFITERIGRDLNGTDLTPELGVDGALQIGAATPELSAMLAGLGPFGSGNAEPRFVWPALRVVKAEIVGQSHVRCILAAGAGPERLKAIAFRALETELGAGLLQSAGRALHIAGHLRADTWQGRNGVQLMIEDAAFVPG
jgi:single-stranded-DNA-specific exonuclease